MNEAIKTLLFVATAVVATMVAVMTYPKQESFRAPDLVGEPLFAEFTDPATASELKIVRFTEGVAKWDEFEVARDKETGLWVIPSSGNYPADAEEQMRNAATELVDLRVIDIASERTAEHSMFGVIEPDRQIVQDSQEGVGLLVSIRNDRGRDLARLIIGKPVRGQPEQHFVRVPGQNAVFVAKIDPKKFPTDFESWIERDLMRLNVLDIENVKLKDYSVLTSKAADGRIVMNKFEQRLNANIRWDAEQGKWVLEQLQEFEQSKPVAVELLPTEELNAQNLDQLKGALANLQIVDVLRKPKGLGADLKAGTEILDNTESVGSLNSRGFFLLRFNDGQPELRAANGEVSIGLRDGVEYLLRFGEIASVESGADDASLNRYLFVTARRDDSKFPPLQLEPEPSTDGADDGKSEDERSELELERERIRRENQRKQDQREEALNRANQRVELLNARFADWYYIISEAEYKKIHLGRDDLIRESAAAKEEGFGIDAFRKLQQDGLSRPTRG
jgi:hypothetical protein